MLPLEGEFHWNKIFASSSSLGLKSESFTFEQWSSLTFFGSSCEGAGKGLIAMMVFAFLGLLAILAMTITRVFAINVPGLRETRRTIFYEMVLTFINTFWFFLGVCIW